MSRNTLLVLLINCMIGQFGFAQSIASTWSGSISFLDSDLPLVFDIVLLNEEYRTTFQSPKQSNQLFEVEKTTVIEDSIFFDIAAIGASYSGQVETDSIVGTFIQMGNQFELTLKKGPYIPKVISKPQDPKPPFSYIIEDVKFTNKKANNINLAGTLTIPTEADSPPVAILISGSGAQDRNEEILGHKPFLVLADHLSNNGIAVLRYDDRGIAASEGEHSDATSADFATDVSAAIDFIKSRTKFQDSPIGLIGHSEGGLIAPIVIVDRPTDISFFVSLAGPGVTGKEILVSQTVAALHVAGAHAEVISFDSLLVTKLCERVLKNDSINLRLDMQSILDTLLSQAVGYSKAKYNNQMQQKVTITYSSPWMIAFINHNPTTYLRHIKCPTLLLNGEKDTQVLPDLNLNAMADAIKLSGNTDVTSLKLQGLNHLFQTATTGSAFEYGKLEETFAPSAMQIISDWINNRF